MIGRRERVDAVIQGAGITGLALALGLARRGLQVTLVDRGAPPVSWSDGEPRLRVSSLNRASEAFLGELGVWSAIVGTRAGAVEAIEARDAAGGGQVRFDAAEAGEPHLAHIVENELVCARLAGGLRAVGVTVLAETAVSSWQSDAAGVTVELENGRRVSARLLVGADGARSAVREHAGIDVSESDYGQSGLVTTVTTERDHGRVARQRFLPGGPLAFLPLYDRRCSIVWSLPTDEAEALKAADGSELCTALTEASDGWLGEVLAVGERGAFPLRRLHARRYVCDRVALVGDAAHVIHPLAGQGANLGLADVRVLTEECARAVAHGRDPGGRAALRRYERRRRGENARMQWAMEAFHRAFTGNRPGLAAARSLGFRVVDRMGPLKALFMAEARGNGG